MTQGRPAAGAELTEEYNPIEAALCRCVSLSKGCYIGQETLAKLSNTGGAKQQLWGLQLSAPAAPGDEIRLPGGGGDKVGKVTSAVNLLESGHFALGYIKSKSKGARVDAVGATVEVNGAPARVVAIPFATRDLAGGGGEGAGAAAAAAAVSASAAAVSDSFSEKAAQAQREKEEAKKAAEEAKAERLRAMQERLAAWQESQKAQQQQT